MKRLLTIILLLLTAQTLFASANDDLSKSKGTDQEVIVSLTPAPEQTDVPRTVKIEATFTIPLDPSSVQKNNIKLTFLSSQTNDHIDGSIGYDDAQRKVVYTPNAPLEPGMYEVEIKSLKPTKAHKTTTIKEIKYRFIVVPEVLENIVISPNAIDVKEGATVQLNAVGHYDNGKEKNLTAEVEWSVADILVASVDANATMTASNEGATTLSAVLDGIENSAGLTVYKEINGHRLPPEPDPQVNNSTLLGIDSNNNGVRDDVERWTILTYKDKHPIVTLIGLQGARAAQIIIQEPERARETRQIFKKAQNCSFYFQFDADFYGEPLLVDKFMWGDEFNNVQFNTVRRARAYAKYNAVLSGGVYTVPPGQETRNQCDFNVTKILEE